MDPQVLQAAERVLAWCRAQVWQSVAESAESGLPELDAGDTEWPAAMPQAANDGVVEPS